MQFAPPGFFEKEGTFRCHTHLSVTKSFGRRAPITVARKIGLKKMLAYEGISRPDADTFHPSQIAMINLYAAAMLIRSVRVGSPGNQLIGRIVDKTDLYLPGAATAPPIQALRSAAQ